MTLPIEKRLRLMGDVSNLMLMGSIHVYGSQKVRVHLTLPNSKHRKESPAASARAA